MAHKPPLVGSIVERKHLSPLSHSKPLSSSKTGFPSVQHRSKSAFSRNREEIRKFGASRLKDVPAVLPSATPLSPPPSNEPDGWRDQISRENEERVAAMTEEEREEERRQILDRFGANVGNILKKARLARTKLPQTSAGGSNDFKEESGQPQAPVPITTEQRPLYDRARSPPRSPPPSALVTPSSTRPSSRAERRLRFAELEPDDVHVYEFHPSSPRKRKALALLPPDPDQEKDVVSLGQFKGKLIPNNAGAIDIEVPLTIDNVEEPEDLEEGSAEYIRKHFFPDAPKDDPNLAWMDVDSPPKPESTSSSPLRFDLHGNVIPPSVSLSLPTHLGLHHHAEGSHAGYTLDDIFLLSRSTVPAQRATMLSMLARIAKHLEEVKNGNVDGMHELVGKEDELRKRILAAGLEALSSRGNVGIHAIEVVWECVVGWDSEIVNLEGVELESSADPTINSLPLDFFLPQVVTLLIQEGVPRESATQLLSILHRLAQQNLTIATSIVSMPELLSTILQTFLLTPILQTDSSPLLPDPLALNLFHTLAVSSRANAEEIEKLADPLLRFVAFSSFDSPYPPALGTTLLVSTLRLYSVLASYGLYSHITGTAIEQFSHIEQFVISEACKSNALAVAWVNLVEAWIICAIDPHQTTPPHDILWSQVVGWTWNTGISELQDRLETREADWPIWVASWQAQAAWLEGSKINAIKGGEAERTEVVDAVKSGFDDGREANVVAGAMDALKEELDAYKPGDLAQIKGMANHVSVLSSAIRLWLGCIAPHLEGVPSSPPFSLPFAELSELTRRLLNHPAWSLRTSPNTFAYRYCREMSQFLSYYLALSKRLPGTSQSLWLAQAFSILLRLGPGDEDFAQSLVVEVSKLLTREWAESQKIQMSSLIWDRGGLAILEPFLSNLIRPKPEVYIGPLVPTPQSIKMSTTQRLPPPVSIDQLGLPLQRDWMMSPVDHLLRSGDSPVFKALPISWDSSEVEVVRSSLFLAKIVQEALLNFSMTPFVPTREESVFNCMKIFMLEHGQQQTDSTEEVFRDAVVGQLMVAILRPYAYGSMDAHIISSNGQEQDDLEKVAARFLGASVPFFQFYTDFVSLYDAISFSHPLFSRLLIPPTSMRYALDYRKHLWCDFNHVVKTIRIPPSQVLSADIREYLYPLESDPQVIASYLASLLKDNISDFMRLVALHHIASNIWPDLRDPSTENENETRASMLLKAVVGQGSLDVVRDVVRYRQTPSDAVVLPPLCFQAIDPVKTSRSDRIMQWGGQVMFDRLRGLFDQ